MRRSHCCVTAARPCSACPQPPADALDAGLGRSLARGCLARPVAARCPRFSQRRCRFSRRSDERNDSAGLRRAPKGVRLFRFGARHGNRRRVMARQTQFTGLGITYALSRGGDVAANALTPFRESATPDEALPGFSKGCPPRRARGQSEGQNTQAPVFRHFIVMA